MRGVLILTIACALQTATGVPLPVDRASNVFFARATINGQGPFWMTVDTGATLTVLDPATAARLDLRLRPADSRPDVGVGGRVTPVATTTGATIVVNGVVPFRPVPLYVVGVRDAEAALGHRIDGVLGHDFLRRFIVEFDYGMGAVRLHPPGAVVAGESARVKVRTTGNRLVVPVRLTLSSGEALRARLLVDTGSSSGISLNSPFAARHRLEERFPSAELSAAVGVNGMTVRAVMQVSSASIGPVALPATRVALSRDQVGLSASTEFDGILGAAVLRHFTLVVDYPRQELALRKAGER
jgi:predicted aspartyl protease